MQQKKTGHKSILSAAAAFALLLLFIVFSMMFPDRSPMLKGIGVLSCALTLWITEAMPISVSALLLVALLPFLGLMDLQGILKNFGLNTALFIMASGGITAAVAAGEIPGRLTLRVLRLGGEKPARLIFAMGILVSLFSAFVSSLATCVLFTGLVAAALRSSGIRPGSSNLGKDMMLVIPACAGIGGFMSPAGTPANILVIDLLAERGTEISFLQWCCIGFPAGLITSSLFICSVLFLFPPEKIALNTSMDMPGAMPRRDRLLLSIVIFVILFWLLGSFFPIFNTTLIALIGLGILFIPGIDLMDMASFSKGVNWDLVIAMGTVSILMTAVSDTGLTEAVSKLVFGSIGSFPMWLLLAAISLCICILRAFIPTTTAVIALFAPMLLTLAGSLAGQYGAAEPTLLLMLSFWAASALLLVFTEPIYLIAYREDYFTAGDLLKAGAVPSLILSLCIGPFIGFLSVFAGIL